MQVNIKPEQEWLVREALASGRYDTPEDFIEDLLVESRAAPPLDDQALIALAEVAIRRGGYHERRPDWKERIKAEASRLPEAG